MVTMKEEGENVQLADNGYIWELLEFALKLAGEVGWLLSLKLLGFCGKRHFLYF